MAGRPLKNDLTGMRIGRLVVIERSQRVSRNPYWTCVCDCGRTIEAQTFDLLCGKVRSCGCYHSERTAEVNRLRSQLKSE